MAEVRPSYLSKFNTVLQVVLFFGLVGNPLWHLDVTSASDWIPDFLISNSIIDIINGCSVSEAGQFIVGLFTIASGIDYALTSRKVFRSVTNKIK